jgi:hypothetical protein
MRAWARANNSSGTIRNSSDYVRTQVSLGFMPPDLESALKGSQMHRTVAIGISDLECPQEFSRDLVRVGCSLSNASVSGFRSNSIRRFGDRSCVALRERLQRGIVATHAFETGD